MGSESGIDQEYGSDLNDAYRNLVETAQWEHGHGGYTGTIAESSGVHLLQTESLSRDDAFELAEKLFEEGHPELEKWGPALAIPLIVKSDQLPSWLFLGIYSC